ncbi:MAG: 4-amino-4-deoxy-L-arabinose transferase, partial [Cyanobium sp.]
PIVRHGRRAMLDGSQLSAIALLWLGLLRARAGGTALVSWGVLSGLAGSALLLLKAPMLVPALAAGLLALRLDPAGRGLPWGRLLLVGLLGLLPGLGWHLFHLGMRGSDALHLWLGDGAVRVLTDAGEGSSEGWRVPVLEMLEGGWPWLLFWPFGVALAWRLRRRSEGCWPLVLQTVMALSILPLRTQLPWYSHPLWLPAALLITPVLAWLVGLDPRPSKHRPPASALLVRIPDVLTLLGALLTLAGLGASSNLRPYSPFLLVIGTGWLIGGLILRPDNRSRRGMGLVSIAAGNGLALLLLMQSHLWNWELAEHWPVGPVAAMVEREAPAQVWIWREDSRPSLNWYARREIRRLRRGTAWKSGTTRWILSRPEDSADLPGRCQTIELAGEWQLMRCRG